MKNIMLENAHLQQIPSRATMFLNLICLKCCISLSLSFCLFSECCRYLFEWKIPCASLGSRCWKKIPTLG